MRYRNLGLAMMAVSARRMPISKEFDLLASRNTPISLSISASVTWPRKALRAVWEMISPAQASTPEEDSG